MPFNALAKGWWKFEQSLEDEVAGHDFELQTGSYPIYDAFQNYNLTDGLQTKHGLVLRDNTFSTPIDSLEVPGINGGYRAGISFWYYSPGPVGQIRHITTQELTFRSAPLIAKADTRIVDGFEDVDKAGSEWLITEIGVSNSRNAIQLLICDNWDSPSIRIVSDSYLPGLHHIFVSIYTAPATNIFYARIDIDGKFGTQHTCSESEVPTIVNSANYLWINKCNYGWEAHHITQEGAFISDLAILTYAEPNSEHMIRSIRFGPLDILTADSNTISYSYFGVGYAQPETVTTTKIFSEGGHIFCARSNGEILEGHKPIWNNEFTFVNQQSLSQLTVVGSSEGISEWTPQGLRLNGTSIRI